MSNCEELDNISKCANMLCEKYNTDIKAILEIISESHAFKNTMVKIMNGECDSKKMMSSVSRVFLSNLIDAKLINIKKDTMYCLGDISKMLKQGIILGKGSFGEVSIGILKDIPIKVAIKKEKVGSTTVVKAKNKNKYKLELWNEVYLTELVANEIINNRMGQAVPLLYKEFGCENNCNFEGMEKSHCIISIMEKADGTLFDWSNKPHSEDEWYNMLFQIMAGLTALQSDKLQIFHNDIKAQNILYHNIAPGGYWKYIIDGNDYYLPNLGFVAIIADYGVSTTFNPSIKYQNPKTRRLGYRGIIRTDSEFCGLVLATRNYKNRINTDNAVITHIEMSLELKNSIDLKPSEYNYDYIKKHDTISYNGLLYYDGSYSKDKYDNVKVKIIPSSLENRINRQDILSKKLLANSSLYPPIEFAFDTQDVIKTFIGGKRTRQPGTHPGFLNLTSSIRKELERYKTTTDTISLKKSKIFGSDFIPEFFQNKYDLQSNHDLINNNILLSTFKC